MTNLLRRLFIKDYKNVKNQHVREKHGVLAAVVGVVSNIILFIIKFFVGLFTNSISIIGDAINNLSDMGSSLITFIGFKLSGKEADKDHPFGHQRIEYITGLIISLIIMFIGLQLGINSIKKIIVPDVVNYSTIAIVMLSISIIIKVWQSLFNRRIGKEIDSVALIATSQDSLNDVISTLVILICALVTKYLNYNIDAYAGVFVSLFILYSGFKMLKESTDPLIGTAIELKFVKEIEEEIRKYENVIGIHDVICHKYGPTKIFMSLHVEVPASMEFILAHDLIDRIEVEIGKRFGIELIIHLDPVDVNCEITQSLKEHLENFILEGKYTNLNFHDFRIVKGITHTNILFDLVIPHSLKDKKKEIFAYFEKKYREINESFNIVITFDYEYVIWGEWNEIKRDSHKESRKYIEFW